MVRRVAGWIVMLALTVMAAVSLVPAPAQAADPSGIAVSGPGIGGTLTISAATQRDQFDAVFRLVSWMSTDRGYAMDLDARSLGPKYTVDVLFGDAPVQRVELYPLARGGPRAFRPADQPGGKKTTPAWFYASVRSPDQLARAGVPVAAPGTARLMRATDGQRDTPKVSMSRARALFLLNFVACIALGVLLTAALGAVARRISRLGL